LARDAELAPSNAFVQYRYGLSLYLDGQETAALAQLEKAVALDPTNPTFQQAVSLLREKLAEAP
jgi:Flp pilus assembly protein TadD